MLKGILASLLFIILIGFIFFSFLGGIIGSYANEYAVSPSIFERTAYAFKYSSYPYVALCFLVGFVTAAYFLKRKL